MADSEIAAALAAIDPARRRPGEASPVPANHSGLKDLPADRLVTALSVIAQLRAADAGAGCIWGACVVGDFLGRVGFEASVEPCVLHLKTASGSNTVGGRFLLDDPGEAPPGTWPGHLVAVIKRSDDLTAYRLLLDPLLWFFAGQVQWPSPPTVEAVAIPPAAERRMVRLGNAEMPSIAVVAEGDNRALWLARDDAAAAGWQAMPGARPKRRHAVVRAMVREFEWRQHQFFVAKLGG